MISDEPPLGWVDAVAVIAAGESAGGKRLAQLRAWPVGTQIAVVAIVYFVVARFGLLFAFVQTNASPVWPAAGAALAAVLVFGPRAALGVGLGAGLVNATTGVPWWAAAAMGVGNGLEVLAAYWLLGRLRFRSTLESYRDLFALAGAAAGAALVSATIGVGVLLVSGGVSSELSGSVWLIWWVGNVLGVFTTAPVALTFFSLDRVAAQGGRFVRRGLESLMLGVAVVAVGTAVFLTTFDSGVVVLAALLVSVPLLLWAAVRFGVRGAALAVLGESVFAVWGTRQGLGPFAWLVGSEADRSVALEIFVAAMSLSTLTLATVLDERFRLQVAVADEQAKAQAVLDTAVNAIITIDEHGVVESLNASAEELFGYPAAEVIGQNVRVFMPEPYHSGHHDFLTHYRETGERHVIGIGREVQGRRKDGSTFDLDLSVSEVQLGNRRIFTGIARDITLRKAFQRDLARAARRMSVAAAASHALAEAQLDEAAMLNLVTRNVAEELGGDTCVASVVAEDAATLVVAVVANTDCAIKDLAADTLHGHRYSLSMLETERGGLNGGSSVISTLPGADRCTILTPTYRSFLAESGSQALLVAPMRVHGAVLGTLCVARRSPSFGNDDIQFVQDLADRAALALSNARLFRAAQDSETHYRRLAEQAPDVICRYRIVPERRFEYVSPASTTVLGYPPEAFYADPDLMVSITHPDDRPAVAAAYGIRGPATSPRLVVARRIRPDGNTVWTETRLTPIFDDTGRVVEVESIVRDVTASKESEADLAHRALHDPVTGLTNRYVFVSDLEHALDRHQRDKRPIVVMFCDLDRFKTVNDTLGHLAGDELLAEAARRLRRVVRPGDTVSRLGGDEFAVLLEPATETHAVARAANRILAAFREPFRVADHEINATVSIGIALNHNGPDDPTELLCHADAALYRAKERGRNRYEVFDDALRNEMADRLDTEKELHEAVPRDEFRTYYQPIRHIQTGRITGVEALLRWQHPTRGLLEAQDFIGVAEDIGVITELQPWAFAGACDQQRAWRDRLGTGAPCVSVNLSARQLGASGLCSTFRRILDDTGVRPEDLTIEFPESVLIEEPDTSLPALTALKDLGMRVAVDHFGTGHSSLTRLRQFPIDTIKIHQSFVSGLTSDLNDAAIVAAITTLAHTLNVTTCAEGVETSHQLAALSDLGCDLVQGYLISPAVPAEEIDSLLHV